MGNNSSSPTHEAPVRNYETGVINYKVAVFGAGQSGKSSIIYWGLHKGQNLPPSNTFLAESFLQDYSVPFVCDGHQHELQLQDTAADESVRALISSLIT
jgi:GTPase SAR1 family protein